MKTIYLKDENYDWKAYEYNELSYLAAELKDRNISIGYGSISIGDDVSIGYGVSIGDHVSIGYGVSIGDHVSIGYGAIIGDRAIIGGRVSIGYGAIIGGRVKLLTGIYFNGSKYPVTYVGEDRISIGCKCYPIDVWKSIGVDIADMEGFTMSEIQEYRGYIDLIELFIKKQAI